MSTSTHTSSTTSQTTAGQDKLAALHEQISDGVAALVESQEWRAMLDTAAKFHTYSLGNLLLIGAQAPQATRVAGFGTWQSLGRQVRKGERGIAILAPCTYRPKTADRAEPAAQAGQEPATSCSGGAAPQGDGKKQVRGFRVVHVFALHQTEGAPLPEVAPSLLVGQAPAGLWDALEGRVLGHGYTVHRGDTGRANGWTDPTSRTVRVSGPWTMPKRSRRSSRARASRVRPRHGSADLPDLPRPLRGSRPRASRTSLPPRTAWTPAATPSPTSPAGPGETSPVSGRPPRPSLKQPARSSATAAPKPGPVPTTWPIPPEPGAWARY